MLAFAPKGRHRCLKLLLRTSSLGPLFHISIQWRVFQNCRNYRARSVSIYIPPVFQGVHSYCLPHKIQRELSTTSTPRAVAISNPAESIATDQSHVGISGAEQVASYNWIENPKPTILVPGIPPVWSVPEIIPHLTPDIGGRIRYIDQNADRNPWSPLEPLFRAVRATNPGYDFKSLDIVTDRRPIRHLLDFADGEAEEFKFRVDIVGKIALFTRMETATREIIPAGEYRGNRHTFEASYTKIPDYAQGSTSHYRVIRYRLGDLQLLIRSAFDAYLEEKVQGQRAKADMKTSTQNDVVRSHAKDLSDVEAPSTQQQSEPPGVTVVAGGEEIAHSALLELTTRSRVTKKTFDIHNKFPDFGFHKRHTMWSPAISRL